MLRIITIIFSCFLFLSGCAVTPKITITGLTSPKSFLISELSEVDYPGFMAGAGNIYSCRYGIHYKEPNEFTPPRDVIFSGLMYKNIPNIENHKLKLTQFDIYYNNRLKLLHAFGKVFSGGVAGDMATQAAKRGHYGFMDKNFLIDSIPQSFPFKTEEVVAGCDNANEGEYYPSRVTGGHDVIVGWYKFTIDGKPYHFRTLYQFQPETKEDVGAGFTTSIKKSIEAIAKQIKI